MTNRRQALLEALTQVQNHPAHAHHDILTITGCGMTDDQVSAHLEASLVQIARFSNFGGNKRRLAKAA